METYAHIVAIGSATGTDNRRISEYQITLNAGGAQWARTLDGEDELLHFLSVDLALKPEIVDGVVTRLHEAGHAMIPRVEIIDTEAPALGLVRSAIDF